MSDILNIISLVSFVLAGILLVLAVVLFFVFKIPSVWGDLSGKNARKSIERMRQNNEKTGKKAHVPSNVNLQRGKLTDKIQETQKMEKPERRKSRRWLSRWNTTCRRDSMIRAFTLRLSEIRCSSGWASIRPAPIRMKM